MKTKLCELFEQDCTEDKFQIKASNNGRFLLTGNYNNCFHLINTQNFNNFQYQLNYRQ